MPTYEYSCEKCGHEFETVQAISAKPLTTCPKEFCAQKKWGRGRVKRKIVAGGGLIFKGSGFYITDYRSKNYTEAAKKDSAAATPAAENKSKAETKSAPAKPATTADKK